MLVSVALFPEQILALYVKENGQRDKSGKRNAGYYCHISLWIHLD